MFLDMQIVVIGEKPIDIPRIASTEADAMIQAVKDGKWLSFGGPNGMKIQVNPANVISFRTRMSNVSEHEAKQGGLIMPNQ